MQNKNFFSLLFTYLFRPDALLVSPSQSELDASGRFVRGYLLPLSFLPAVSFGIVKIYASLMDPTNVTGSTIMIDVFGIIMAGLTGFLLAHFWSVIIDGLLSAKNISSSGGRGYFVTAYAATPWFVTYALFPLIRGFCFIGLLWAAVRMRSALENIAGVPKEMSLKLSLALCFMWLAALLFINLVFAGLMSMMIA